MMSKNNQRKNGEFIIIPGQHNSAWKWKEKVFKVVHWHFWKEEKWSKILLKVKYFIVFTRWFKWINPTRTSNWNFIERITTKNAKPRKRNQNSTTKAYTVNIADTTGTSDSWYYIYKFAKPDPTNRLLIVLSKTNFKARIQ